MQSKPLLLAATLGAFMGTTPTQAVNLSCPENDSEEDKGQEYDETD